MSSGALRECNDCGLILAMPASLGHDESARCPRCDHVLARPRWHGIELSLCCSGLALILLLMALPSTVMALHAAGGRFSSATLFTGPETLARRGLWYFAGLVLTILILAPAAKILILLIVGMAARASRPSRSVRWMFGWLDRITPWAMVEVFLAGAAVAYSRLVTMANVELGPALPCCFGLAAALGAADAALDRGEVWKRLAPGHFASPYHGGHLGTLVACDVCALVLTVRSGQRCPRCHHRLRHRKPNCIATTKD